MRKRGPTAVELDASPEDLGGANTSPGHWADARDALYELV